MKIKRFLTIAIMCLLLLPQIACGNVDGGDAAKFPDLYQRNGVISEKKDFAVGAVLDHKAVSVLSYDKKSSAMSEEYVIHQDGTRVLIDFNDSGKGVLLLCGDIAAGTEYHTFYSSADYGKTWNRCRFEEPSYTMITDMSLSDDGDISLWYLSIEQDHDGSDLYVIKDEEIVFQPNKNPFPVPA